MENQVEENVYVSLKKFYDESETRVKNNAMICRAYTDRISTETINEKVDAQLNAIRIGIQEINPKFKEGAKNYDTIKSQVLESMSNYENVLKELSEFYDGKIEQLILRKVELEANLVGSILNEKYLAERLETKKVEKENDNVKKSIKITLKNAIEKISKKKKDNVELDTKMIEKLSDGRDIENEIANKLEVRVAQTEEKQAVNKDSINKAEKEIKLIDDEIKRINDRKKQSLFDAMEIGDKALATSIKRPRIFKKITRFFISRFNTPKVVKNTILDPFNQRIENFKANELVNIKG